MAFSSDKLSDGSQMYFVKNADCTCYVIAFYAAAYNYACISVGTLLYR